MVPSRSPGPRARTVQQVGGEVTTCVHLNKWGRGPTSGHERSCRGLRALRASACPVQSLFVVAADP